MFYFTSKSSENKEKPRQKPWFLWLRRQDSNHVLLRCPAEFASVEADANSCRPLPLAQVASSATGSAPFAPLRVMSNEFGSRKTEESDQKAGVLPPPRRPDADRETKTGLRKAAATTLTYLVFFSFSPN